MVVETISGSSTVSLYTLTDASQHLVVRRSTLETWANGYERRPKARAVVKGEPIITALPAAHRRSATLPFVGIAEAFALNAFPAPAGDPAARRG